MKKDSTPPIITRFAPSPTGFLHIGSIRTALYGYLLAKKTGGEFILRVEDTDKFREVEGGVEIIHQTLQALKLDWDQEFKQSDRLDIYKKWAEKLVEKGLAYADNLRAEEVEAWREDAKLNKKPFLYRDYITEKRKVEWVYGENVLRLKSNPKRWDWHDMVRGDLTAGPEAVDDLVLIKADGYPTYNFCHIIDDFEMGITHILRGDEFISSTPKFLSIYEALDIEHPEFVTLPPIMAPGGKKKLGKRDGAKDALEYLADGVLIDGLLNFLALLGWNPGKGNNQEIFTVDQLIEEFSISGIGKSGANYDEKRLEWINGHHIRTLSLDQLFELAKNFMPKEAAAFSEAHQKQVLSLVQERLKFLNELPELTSFFFKKPELTKAELLDVKGLEGEAQAKQFITHTLNLIKDSDFSPEDLQTKLNQALEDLQTKPAVLFALLRNALTGARFTPPLNNTMSVLGKDEAVERLSLSIQ
jgi:glutamyl-tRNA synthetase